MTNKTLHHHSTRAPARLALVTIAATLLGGCQPATQPAASSHKFNAEYQAVFLDNGQVVFGKLEQFGSDYPVLRNPFTVQSQTNLETKQVSSALVRRSVELHGPDYMLLNARHIVVVEPVGADSRVAQVIKQAEAQAPAPNKP
jgi:hypothetical protein